MGEKDRIKEGEKGLPSGFLAFAFWLQPKPTTYWPKLFLQIVFLQQLLRLWSDNRMWKRRCWDIVMWMHGHTHFSSSLQTNFWLCFVFPLIGGWDMGMFDVPAWLGLILHWANSAGTWYSSGQRSGWPSVHLNIQRQSHSLASLPLESTRSHFVLSSYMKQFVSN